MVSAGKDISRRGRGKTTFLPICIFPSTWYPMVAGVPSLPGQPNGTPLWWAAVLLSWLTTYNFSSKTMKNHDIWNLETGCPLSISLQKGTRPWPWQILNCPASLIETWAAFEHAGVQWRDLRPYLAVFGKFLSRFRPKFKFFAWCFFVCKKNVLKTQVKMQ